MGDVIRFPTARPTVTASDFAKAETIRLHPPLLAFRADVFLINGTVGFSLIHPPKSGPKVGRSTAAMMLRMAADKLDQHPVKP